MRNHFRATEKNDSSKISLESYQLLESLTDDILRDPDLADVLMYFLQDTHLPESNWQRLINELKHALLETEKSSNENWYATSDYIKENSDYRRKVILQVAHNLIESGDESELVHDK